MPATTETTDPTNLARAPGKLILFGEYAVLGGVEAMVMAIDRFATAHQSSAPRPPGPFLRRAEKLIGDALPRLDNDHSVRVDTSEFRAHGRKLGLGSSAAATVAYVGARCAGQLSRAQIHAIAHRAHGDASAQAGARGSGVDIAASIWGGIIGAKPQTEDRAVAVRPLNLPDGLTWCAVDCGQSADTRVLIAQIGEFSSRSPALFTAAMTAIEDAAILALHAASNNDVPTMIAAVEQGQAAINRLAIDANAPLIVDTMTTISELASASQGAAKSTGAAGGDTAWAVFPNPAHATEFRDRLHANGIKVVSLNVEPDGLSLTKGFKENGENK